MITIHKRNECTFFNVYNWIQFFVSRYNNTTSKKNYFIIELNERGKYILLTERPTHTIPK